MEAYEMKNIYKVSVKLQGYKYESTKHEVSETVFAEDVEEAIQIVKDIAKRYLTKQFGYKEDELKFKVTWILMSYVDWLIVKQLYDLVKQSGLIIYVGGYNQMMYRNLKTGMVVHTSFESFEKEKSNIAKIAN